MKLYGAILGDLAGQPYEFKYKGDYSEFNIYNEKSVITDDSLMTLASAGYFLGMFESFEEAYKIIGNKYFGDYYGKSFKEWLKSSKGTQNDSYGNGCLMRISPCIYSENPQLNSIQSCLCSHLHSESILSIYRLVELYNSVTLRRKTSKFHPEHHMIQFNGKFDVSAKGTMDFIENAYYLSNSTHDTIEKVVKLGGDTDTNASIIGELMIYTFKDLTKIDKEYVESKLDDYLLNILLKFNKLY